MIELPDEQAAALKAKAAARGCPSRLGSASWLTKGPGQDSNPRNRPTACWPIWPRSFRRGNRREPPGDVPQLRRRLLLMIAGGADTRTALWYLLKNPRLSATARQFMDDAAAAGHDIVLS